MDLYSAQIHALSANCPAVDGAFNACEHRQAWLAEKEVAGPSCPGELSPVFEAVFAKMDKKLIHWLKGEHSWHTYQISSPHMDISSVAANPLRTLSSHVLL